MIKLAMRLEDYPKDKLDSELKKIVGKYLNLGEYELFYFGSRVANKGDGRSDIDVGIKGAQKVDSNVLSKIKEEINWLPTLYSVDIVDFTDTSEEFREVAEQETEKIL